MKRVAILLGVVLVLALGVTILLVLTKRTDREGVRIGIVGPYSGQLASWGGFLRRGVELGYNELSVDERRRITLFYEDSEGDPKKAVSAVQKLISANEVQVIIGPVTSSEVLSAAPIVEKSKFVLLAPMAPHKDITYAGDYVFRIYPSDEKRSVMLADYTVSELKAQRVAVLYRADEFGTATFAEYSKRLLELAISEQAIIAENYQPGITDFRTVITKIKSRRPPVTFIVGHSKDLGYIVKQSFELGFKTQFLSTADFEHPDVLKIAADAANGTIYGYMVFDITGSDSLIGSFREKYQRYFHTSEEPGLPVALAFDAFGVINAALKGPQNAEQIKNRLYQLKDYPGVTGKITFDQNGDVTRSWGLKIVEGGRFRTLRTVYP